MKKLLIVVLFSSLGIFASAGYSLTANTNDYTPGSYVGLVAGQSTLRLTSSEPFSSPLLLSLCPIQNAHFIQFPSLIPWPWDIYSENDCDYLFVDFLPSPTYQNPVYYFDFNIEFVVQADLSVLDSDTAELLATWHLVSPEPASLLLLGLGGLAMRMRKK
ncbi:MAG: PEP-CTERM sorting domain-containing protein [Planctomycetes bacterium]|nr:PEP-CTERM sorting domain-containing protein [Planctomycetota bacterium]